MERPSYGKDMPQECTLLSEEGGDRTILLIHLGRVLVREDCMVPTVGPCFIRSLM